METHANTYISMVTVLFIVILGLFFLYLIMNHLMNQSSTVETMTTPLSQGTIKKCENNN